MVQIRSICISAHLDSFCRELSKLVDMEFCYESEPGLMRQKIGWNLTAPYANCLISPENTRRAETCELVIDMMREQDLIEKRSSAGLPSVYMSERWFKPLVIKGFRIPGVWRLLVPSYRRMARKYVELMDDPNVWFFPFGVHAVQDFVRMYRILHGDLTAFFREPSVVVERSLAGRVSGFPQMRLWGYFVEPSCVGVSRIGQSPDVLKILWVGRMLDWKRVDVLIKAFKKVSRRRTAALVLVGEGPERSRLERLAGSQKAYGREWQPGKICFHDYIPNSEVRDLLRRADVYVMPSNAEEGWGAAVSDAIAEGCPVISTFEAGSSATLLPRCCLFHAGDVSRLRDLLMSDKFERSCDSESWSGKTAATKFVSLVMNRR